MMTREWKTLNNFSNYLISNYGEVISLPQKGNHYKEPKPLKQTIDKDGYKVVGMVNDNKKRKIMKVHRLVALAFIPNPNNYKCINHKNENKMDNAFNNLEWCDVKYNNNYGTRLSKVSKSNSKKIKQLDKQGNFIKLWENAQVAANELNICRTSIYGCCNKKPHFITVGGFKWEYLKEGDLIG